MRLTVKDDRETIKRFSHVRPARGWRTALCAAKCTGVVRSCTLAKDHRGPHVAHGLFKKVVAVWYSEPAVPTSVEAPGRIARARAQSGLRARTSPGALKSLWSYLASSGEEIALLLMFLLFAKFAVDWLLLILR